MDSLDQKTPNPHLSKKIWNSPELNLISSNNINTGTTTLGPSEKTANPAFKIYYRS
jgi:hypothetical protein